MQRVVVFVLYFFFLYFCNSRVAFLSMEREWKKELRREAVLMPCLLRQSRMSAEMLGLGSRGRGGVIGVTAPQFLYVAIPQGYF